MNRFAARLRASLDRPCAPWPVEPVGTKGVPIALDLASGGSNKGLEKEKVPLPPGAQPPGPISPNCIGIICRSTRIV